jgi:hypothetical protein
MLIANALHVNIQDVYVGVSWDLIKAPEKTHDGSAYQCKVKPMYCGKRLGFSPYDFLQEDCYLHLHGYTETESIENIYSSTTSAGVMVGIGNVGKFLDSVKNANTYISYDAGLSWTEIRKGPYMHAFGQHGSLVVLVPYSEASNYIL